MVCWGRPCHFKFFKDCLPQILLGPFLNTLSHLIVSFFIQFVSSVTKQSFVPLHMINALSIYRKNSRDISFISVNIFSSNCAMNRLAQDAVYTVPIEYFTFWMKLTELKTKLFKVAIKLRTKIRINANGLHY